MRISRSARDSVSPIPNFTMAYYNLEFRTIKRFFVPRKFRFEIRIRNTLLRVSKTPMHNTYILCIVRLVCCMTCRPRPYSSIEGDPVQTIVNGIFNKNFNIYHAEVLSESNMCSIQLFFAFFIQVLTIR